MPELVVTTMTRADAVAITERIRRQLVDLFDTIVEAFTGRVWLALDYGSWEDYVNGEGLKTHDERTIVRLVDESELSDAAVAAIASVTSQAVGKRRRKRQHETQLRAEPGAKTLGKDGKRQPSTRPSPHEIEHRRDIVEQLWADRYGRDAISDTLDVSHGTIDGDLLARQIDKRAKRGPLRTSALPAHIAWRDGEQGSPPPKPIKVKLPKPVEPIEQIERQRWREQRTVDRLLLFHEAFDDERLAAQLATAIDDALLSDSTDARLWLVELRDLLRAVAREVQTLVALERDDEYRARVIEAPRAKDVPSPPPVSL